MLSKTNSKPRSNRLPKKHSIESLEARQLFAVDLLAVSTHGDTAPVILGSADLVDPIAQAAPDAPCSYTTKRHLKSLWKTRYLWRKGRKLSSRFA